MQVNAALSEMDPTALASHSIAIVDDSSAFVSDQLVPSDDEDIVTQLASTPTGKGGDTPISYTFKRGEATTQGSGESTSEGNTRIVRPRPEPAVAGLTPTNPSGDETEAELSHEPSTEGQATASTESPGLREENPQEDAETPRAPPTSPIGATSGVDLTGARSTAVVRFVDLIGYMVVTPPDSNFAATGAEQTYTPTKGPISSEHVTAPASQPLLLIHSTAATDAPSVPLLKLDTIAPPDQDRVMATVASTLIKPPGPTMTKASSQRTAEPSSVSALVRSSTSPAVTPMFVPRQSPTPARTTSEPSARQGSGKYVYNYIRANQNQ